MFLSATQEINFQIGRVCAAFSNLGEDTDDTRRCIAFMQRIPFNGTVNGASEADLRPSSASHPEPVALPTEQTLKEIEGSFVSFMKDPSIGSTKLSDIVHLYTSDFGPIAYLNQDYSINIVRDYEMQLTNYGALCRYALELSLSVNYRKINVGPCATYTAGIPSPTSPTASPGFDHNDPLGILASKGALGARLPISDRADARNQRSANSTASIGTSPPPPPLWPEASAPPIRSADDEAPAPGPDIETPDANQPGAVGAQSPPLIGDQPILDLNSVPFAQQQRDFELVSQYMFFMIV